MEKLVLLPKSFSMFFFHCICDMFLTWLKSFFIYGHENSCDKREYMG